MGTELVPTRRTVIVPLSHLVSMLDSYCQQTGAIGPKEEINAMVVPIITDKEHNFELTLHILPSANNDKSLN